MKTLLFGILFTFSTLFAFSQNGWQAGNYYMYRGEAIENCGYSYAKYDYWGQYIGQYIMCQTLRWERQEHGGYVYVWGPYGWTSQWYQGYAWYCYWSDYYEKRVW